MKLLRAAALIALFFSCADLASAQKAELVDEFVLAPKQPAAPPTLAGDGNVYGTTVEGGAYGFGAVYRIVPGRGIEGVASFTGNDGNLPGDLPSSALVLAGDGNLYGVTEWGGEAGNGTVFKVVPGQQATSVASFTGDRGTLPGGQPHRSLTVGADGNLYGVTRIGGSASVGTVFRVNIADGTVNHLASFTGETGVVRGFHPHSTLAVAGDGQMYGAATTADGLGLIFKLSTSGAVSTVAKFTGHEGNLQGNSRFTAHRFTADNQGNLYGVSGQGGPGGFGTVFKIVPGGQARSIATFTGTGGVLPGAYPYNNAYLTLGADGAMYGTTAQGGSANSGVVYRVQTTDDTVATIATFTGSGGALPGRTPHSSLTKGADGNLYGTLRDGPGAGSVYRIPMEGPASIVGSLTGHFGAAPGNNLEIPVVALENGDLIGVTQNGGVGNNGAAFVVKDGTGLESLGLFADEKGSAPRVALTAADDGLLYGTTPKGGSGGKGLIFSVAPGRGGIQPIASFTGEGGPLPGDMPWASLTRGENGKLYGTTLSGGTSRDGTIFRLTPGGAVELLDVFRGSGVLLGRTPKGELVPGPDGRLFGTAAPDFAGRGAFYWVKLSGEAESLAGTYNSAPEVPLVLADNGMFYGVSAGGGIGFGTVVTVNPQDGSILELAEFTGPSGALPGRIPRSKLGKASDGFLYGTTTFGGTVNHGTVFRVSSAGVVTSLGSFTGTAGALPGSDPSSALVEGEDGNLYGVTRAGGAGNFGVVFRVRTGATPSLETVASFTGSSGSLPGKSPGVDLVTGPDGNLYGSTEKGGVNDHGTLFKVVPGGAVTSRASFTGAGGELPGAAPLAPLTLADDGNLYGSSSAMGSGGGGTLFRLIFGPSVQTGTASETSFTRATAKALVDPNGEPTEIWFEYGTTASLGSATSATVLAADAGSSDVTTSLTQLSPGTTYHLRVVGRNATGTQRGEITTFKTKDPTEPASVTTSAEEIGVREARLIGSVTANGLATAAYFQLDAEGENTRSTAVQLFGAEDLEKPFEIVVSGLLPHTKYEYRAVATNPLGMGTGETLSFTTANTVPVGVDKNVHAPAVGASAVVYRATDGSDVDGDPLTLAVEQYEGSGNVTTTGSEIVYAGGGFVGSETLQVRISDGFGGSTVATVTLHNAAPAAGADSFQVGATGAVLEVLSNDTDADQDALVIAGVSEAAGGTLSHDGQRITYTPGAGFRGYDQFSYTVSDQHGGSAVGSVMVMADYSVAQTLAMKDEAAPGSEGAVWSRFGAPSIFEQGREAGWLATIKAGKQQEQGIYSGPIGAPVLRVRAGDRARDAAGQPIAGSQFRSFKDPVFAGRSFAFVARVSGSGITPAGDAGLWIGNDDSLREIAREGSDAPGTNGAKFQAFTSVAMPGSDAVFFTAKLKTGRGGVSRNSSNGLWVWTPGGTRLVLRNGQGVDFGSGTLRVRNFKVFSAVAGSAGHGRYDAHEQSVDVLVSFSDGAMAVLRSGTDAGLSLVALTGQTDQSGRRPVQIGLPASPGNGAAPVALVTFQTGPGGITKENSVAVWNFAEDQILAQSGAPAPGITGGSFKSIQDPVAGYGLGEERVTAFMASVRGAAKAEDTGVWVHTAGESSSLELLAREGSEPPGAPGTRWKKFESVSVMEGRGVVFTGKLASGSAAVTGSNDRGVWVTTTAGELQLVLREGDQIGSKTLRSFSVLDTVAGSPGQRRAWTIDDQAGTLVYLAYFTDGSSGIHTLSIP